MDFDIPKVYDICAPSKEFKDGSCYSIKSLISLAKAYNKFVAKKKNADIIKFKWSSDQDAEKYRKYLINELTERFKSKCDKSQTCWIKQAFIKELSDDELLEMQENTFKPIAPQGKFTWLNTININEVMAQYESKHPEFKFFGAVPIDFDEVSLEISTINYKKLLKQGKTKLGIIFNLDKHYEPGSHWISMYADIKHGEICFFDSYGVAPPKEVEILMKRIEKFYQSNFSSTPMIKINKMQHQKGNSECGVYSLYFIVSLLKGTTFNKLTKDRINDTYVNKFRNVFFRKKDEN